MSGFLQVEVFPVAEDRWIAVIDAPRGAFSTEATRPAGVHAEVRDSIREVLGRDIDFQLLDELGALWTVEAAREQLRRMVG